MSKIIGRLVDVGVGKESSRGGGAAATYWLPKSNITVNDKVTKARSALSYGSINAEGNQVLNVQKWAEGDIEMDMFDRSFGLVLLSLLGTVNTAGPTDSTYTHTFSLQNDSQHDSLAISVKESDIGSLMYKLAMIESMEMTIVPEDVVKLTISFMAKQGATATPTVSYIAENKFTGRHLTFKTANLASGLTAASGIPLKSLKLTFDKRLKMDSVLGTVEPVDFLNQAFSITGEIQLNYENSTYHDLMMNGTYKAVRIDLVNDEVTIGVSSNPAFRLDLSRCDFSEWENERPNDEIAMQTIQFAALYDITNGNVINDCYLKNTATSY